jgi:hypothetical protein
MSTNVSTIPLLETCPLKASTLMLLAYPSGEFRNGPEKNCKKIFTIHVGD